MEDSIFQTFSQIKRGGGHPRHERAEQALSHEKEKMERNRDGTKGQLAEGKRV